MKPYNCLVVNEVTSKIWLLSWLKDLFLKFYAFYEQNLWLHEKKWYRKWNSNITLLFRGKPTKCNKTTARYRGSLKCRDNFSDMGDWAIQSIVKEQEGCLLKRKTKTIFQNMKFVPRPYLPFNEAYLQHIKLSCIVNYLYNRNTVHSSLVHEAWRCVRTSTWVITREIFEICEIKTAK